VNNVTISLCTDTHPVAQRMGNFSGWVRSKLKAFSSGADDPVVSECSSVRLLAVVLARHQSQTGNYNDAMCVCLLEAIRQHQDA